MPKFGMTTAGDLRTRQTDARRRLLRLEASNRVGGTSGSRAIMGPHVTILNADVDTTIGVGS